MVGVAVVVGVGVGVAVVVAVGVGVAVVVAVAVAVVVVVVVVVAVVVVVVVGVAVGVAVGVEVGVKRLVIVAWTKRLSWWEQEEFTEKDFDAIFNSYGIRVFDFLFSHTCPMEYEIKDKWDAHDKKEDMSRHWLSVLRNHYMPLHHFFGHWHRYRGGKYMETTWQCLNTISQGFEHYGRYVLDISNLFEEKADDKK